LYLIDLVNFKSLLEKDVEEGDGKGDRDGRGKENEKDKERTLLLKRHPPAYNRSETLRNKRISKVQNAKTILSQHYKDNGSNNNKNGNTSTTTTTTTNTTNTPPLSPTAASTNDPELGWILIILQSKTHTEQEVIDASKGLLQSWAESVNRMDEGGDDGEEITEKDLSIDEEREYLRTNAEVSMID